MIDWDFKAWPAVETDGQVEAGGTPFDINQYHVDLGCGTRKRARIGIDRYDAPGVDVVMTLDDPSVYLPMPTSSIESIVTHHAMEHIRHFIPLMDEIYRVLKPAGLFYMIVPLFPSYSAVADPDHKRYFMEGTMDVFCGHLGSAENPTGSWLDAFSVPYTKARFEKLYETCTPRVAPELHWTRDDVRELRVGMRAVK